jgi:hypothetical protein
MRLISNIFCARANLSASVFSTFVAVAFSINSVAQTIAIPPKKNLITSTAKPEKVSDTVIQGQVFVVTKGGESIKLGLVGISAYQFNKLKSPINDKWEQDRGARDKASVTFSELTQKIDLAKQNAMDLELKTNIAENLHLANPEDPDLWRDFTASRDLKHAANALYKRIASDNTVAQLSAASNYKALTNPRVFIGILQNPKETTKSDANGNFEMTLPAGIYGLVATSQRMQGGSYEYYEWIIKVNAKKPTQKIMLSNDNLFETRCDECISIPLIP